MHIDENGDIQMSPEEFNEIVKQDNIRALNIKLEQDVKDITIMYDGSEYDGDEVSQGRMVKAIMTSTGSTLDWVGSDNIAHNLTSNQLNDILSLAVDEHSRLVLECNILKLENI